MFYSTYIPINIHRVNCAIYSNEKIFPIAKLKDAYAFISGEKVNGVIMNEGNVSFVDSPDTIWTVPEIYLAYEAYTQAEKNNFSFYVVKDKDNIPQLFVSKAFKGHRILVNAFTMHSTLLTKKQLVDKAASVIDKTYSVTYCNALYDTLEAIESGSAKFLSALVVGKGTEDEYLAVNPLTTVLSEMTSRYGADIIQEFRDILADPEHDTESFTCVNNRYIRKDLPESWSPLPADHLRNIISIYDSVISKKSNYIELNNENYETEYYFSTNYRYLVNAKTFECVIIKNKHTKDLLIQMAMQNRVPSERLALAWMLAKTE